MGFVCPNTSCRKVFTRPLKTVNVGVSSEPFNACPYCLTEITGEAKPISAAPQVEVTKEPETATKTESPLAPAECKRHFGYLSQRGAKEQIPDECLTCKEIVQCMFKPTTENVGTK
jgi:hypothetical protein